MIKLKHLNYIKKSKEKLLHSPHALSKQFIQLKLNISISEREIILRDPRQNHLITELYANRKPRFGWQLVWEFRCAFIRGSFRVVAIRPGSKYICIFEYLATIVTAIRGSFILALQRTSKCCKMRIKRKMSEHKIWNVRAVYSTQRNPLPSQEKKGVNIAVTSLYFLGKIHAREQKMKIYSFFSLPCFLVEQQEKYNVLS